MKKKKKKLVSVPQSECTGDFAVDKKNSSLKSIRLLIFITYILYISEEKNK